jgi:hypothetical protein
MSEQFRLIVSYSATLLMAIGLVYAIIRRKRLGAYYQPFYVYLIVSFVFELVLKIIVNLGYKSPLIANCYVLVEFPIFLWLFYNWSSRNNKIYFIGLFLIGVVIWIFDNLIMNSIFQVNSYYRIYYSVVLILCSINQLNKVIFQDNIILWKNATFLISITSVVYYSYRVFIEGLFLFQHEFSNDFFRGVYYIMVIVNFFAHLVYTLAVLCIPAKQEFTLRY